MRLGNDDRTPLPTLQAHEQVSGYRLVKRRGRGGFAEVWEAESPRCGRRVALKLVHLSTDLRSGELRALKITREIRHPSLVLVHETWQVDSLLVISMELADRSLGDRFLEAEAQGLRGIPRPELLGYLGSVADAIDYLNEYKHSIAGREGVGIQHRDLKPQNILLLGDRAKVADFGLARVMEQAVASHTGPCTLPYAAPEYFSGETSRQSDQYALAVTYCQLRGGRMPFRGTTAQVIFGHLHKAPDVGGLPAPERPIVTRALAKSPDDRWPDCRSFIDALKALGDARGCPVPDLLPRDQRVIASLQDEERDPALLSGSSIDWMDFDVVTGEAFDFQAAGSRNEQVAPSGPTQFDHGSASDGWPGGGEPDRRAARKAGIRSKRARFGQVAVMSALGLVLLTRGVWSVAARSRLGTPSGDMAAASDAPPAPTIGTAGGPLGTGNRAMTMAGAPVASDDPRGAIPDAPDVTEKREETTTGPVVAAAVPDASGPEAPESASDGSKEIAAGTLASSGPKSEPGSPRSPALITPVMAPPPPASDQARVEAGSMTAVPSAGADGDPGTPAEADPVASEVNIPSIRLPAEVTITAGEATNVLPSAATVACDRGRAELARDAYAQAINSFTEAIRGAPDSFEARFHRGVAYYLSGRRREALEDYTMAIAIRPGHVDAYLVRARVQVDLGKEDLALEDYTEAIRLRPDARNYLARGSLHHEMGAYDRALADYETALRLRPDNPSAHYRRGLTHYFMGENAGAIRDFTEVIRLNPGYPDAYRYRGDAFARLGKFAMAGADRDTFERLGRPTGKDLLK